MVFLPGQTRTRGKRVLTLRKIVHPLDPFVGDENDAAWQILSKAAPMIPGIYGVDARGLKPIEVAQVERPSLAAKGGDVHGGNVRLRIGFCSGIA